jgi:hypothetical protein
MQGLFLQAHGALPSDFVFLALAHSRDILLFVRGRVDSESETRVFEPHPTRKFLSFIMLPCLGSARRPESFSVN